MRGAWYGGFRDGLLDGVGGKGREGKRRQAAWRGGGVVWRVQKRLIAWTRANSEQGTPMPPEAERLARWGFIASRVGFWLSFPMLFLMGAAEHYPFLSSN